MIKLINVDKYYNKHKKNCLHVINNVSLTLEDSGLVALLGPSGCGKTTMLNAIGGLDKTNKGQIYINDDKISSKSTYKVDKIRNLNIGYIFQDYKLVDSLSVYDNVALVLKMIGIKDKKEIKKRVEYVLEKTGMLRYKRRPAGMLSGGERQRVGIARAIVKDPDIILADEPTGNLDSKNSLEIMKIIKAISKDRLVILVTHEQSLAKFYATRIIEIKDGIILKDYKNESADSLDYELDNNFYLKDFKYNNKLKEENVDIDIYSDSKEKVKLDIVLKNGNIYIKSNTLDKVEVVEDNSSIEFIDDHYKKIDKSDIEKLEFNFKDVIDKNVKKKYSSILNPFTLLVQGFKKVFDFPILKKILLIGFLISGMFIMYATASISSTFDIREEDFVSINRNYLTVKQNKLSVNDYLDYEKIDGVNYILPGDSTVNFKFFVKDYYQTYRNSSNLSGSLSDITMITEKDLIMGRMPNNSYEVVVDKKAIENMLNNSEELKMSGITNYELVLDRVINIDNMNDFKIVGITDLKSPSIYCSKDLFINMLYNSKEKENYYSDLDNSGLMDYSLFEDKIELKQGRLPNNDYEVIVNISNKTTMPLNKQINYTVNDTKLTVVGYYDTMYDYDYYLVNNNTIKYNLITSSKDLSIYSNDKLKSLNDFRNLNLNIKDSYEYSKSNYKESIKESNTSTLIISGIMLLISLTEMFLMIRSSFLSRIKEIGIFRAIGVKRIDIYKMFYGEIFAITTLTSVPGLLFMAYVLSVLREIKMLERLFLVNTATILISILLVYVFNLLIGLIPVFNVVRKTPAQILSRHDLD